MIFLKIEYGNKQLFTSICSIGILRIAVFMKLNIAVSNFNALVIVGFEYHLGNIFRFFSLFCRLISQTTEIASKYKKRRKIGLILKGIIAKKPLS